MKHQTKENKMNAKITNRTYDKDYSQQFVVSTESNGRLISVEVECRKKYGSSTFSPAEVSWASYGTVTAQTATDFSSVLCIALGIATLLDIGLYSAAADRATEA